MIKEPKLGLTGSFVAHPPTDHPRSCASASVLDLLTLRFGGLDRNRHRGLLWSLLLVLAPARYVRPRHMRRSVETLKGPTLAIGIAVRLLDAIEGVKRKPTDPIRSSPVNRSSPERSLRPPYQSVVHHQLDDAVCYCVRGCGCELVERSLPRGRRQHVGLRFSSTVAPSRR